MKPVIAPIFLSLLLLVLPAAQARSDMDLLVTTEWLAEHLEDEDLVLLHVGGPDAYEKAHIPGARRASLRPFNVQTPAGIRDEMPTVAVMSEELGKLGVSSESRIVLYWEDGRLIPLATRFALILDYLGLGDRTAILDGGLAAWRDEERPLEDGIENPGAARFVARPRADLLVDSGWIAERLRDRDVVLVDARPAEVYLGKVDHGEKRPGHIPGAVNLPFFELNEEDPPQRFKSRDELRRLFREAGVPRDVTVVAHCGTGIWACPVYFAARLLGYEVRFYDGSFQEWASDPAREVIGPVARGSVD